MNKQPIEIGVAVITLLLAKDDDEQTQAIHQRLEETLREYAPELSNEALSAVAASTTSYVRTIGHASWAALASAVQSLELEDRGCTSCGADLVGNDPHSPDCPRDANGMTHSQAAHLLDVYRINGIMTRADISDVTVLLDRATSDDDEANDAYVTAAAHILIAATPRSFDMRACLAGVR